MTSLMPGPLFKNPGLNQSHTPTEITASPEQIKTKYRRASIEGRDWPADSPVAQVYDISNTSSRLILLNNRMNKGTHLRVQSARSKKKEQEESNAESSRHFKESSTNSVRHIECHDSSTPYFESPSYRSPSASGHKNRTPRSRPHTSLGHNEKDREWHHYSSHASYSARSDTMTRQKSSRMKERDELKPPPSFRRDKSWLLHPDMTLGQKRYIHEIAKVYDMTHMKQLKQAQYLQLIYREQKRDFFTPENYRRYLAYLRSERIIPFDLEKAPSVLCKSSKPTAKKTKGQGQSSEIKTGAETQDSEDKRSDRKKKFDRPESSRKEARPSKNEEKLDKKQIQKTGKEDKEKRNHTNNKTSYPSSDKTSRKGSEKPKSNKTKLLSPPSSSSSSDDNVSVSSFSSDDAKLSTSRSSYLRPKTSVGARQRPDRQEREDRHYWKQPPPPEPEKEPTGKGLVMTKDNDLKYNDEHILEIMSKELQSKSTKKKATKKTGSQSSIDKNYDDTHDIQSDDGTQTRVYNPRDTRK